ncbi:MAG: hypothetical protein ACYDCC_09265 [Actinomycetota bacterium]
MTYTIQYDGVVTRGDGMPTDDTENHLDSVMQELLKLSDVNDAAIGVVEATASVEITVTIDATSLEEALNRGSAAIRAAIHAAGGATPGWSIEWCEVVGRKNNELIDA